MDQVPKPTRYNRPPATADMIHELGGNQGQKVNTEKLAQPALNRLQMSWAADVEDVYPIIGASSFFLMKEYPNPHKLVYVTSLSDVERVIGALKTSLESWSIFRSIAFEYDPATRLIVVLRATQRYFDQAISINEDVENEHALTKVSMSANHAASELPRGLMFRIVVARLKSTSTVGVVVLANHAIYDAVSINRWAQDVERLILGSYTIERIPYKAFAEAYYLYRTSLAAKLTTDYHVNRLKGIGAMHHALWPPPQLVQSVLDRAAQPNNEGEAEAVEGGGRNNPQIIRYRRLPNIIRTSRKTSTILYAAIACFNASITGSKHAVFIIALAGREWPFIHDTLAQLLPDPMDIAGPTWTGSTAIVNVNDAELISQFLARLEGDLNLLRRHQHVPQDFAARLGEEDRAVMRDAQRQFFNYLPKGTGVSPKDRVSGDEAWRVVSNTDYKVDKSDGSFFWNIGLEEPPRLRIRAQFNPDMFSEKEVELFMESVFDAAEFLSDTANWEKEVGELRAALSKKREAFVSTT